MAKKKYSPAPAKKAMPMTDMPMMTDMPKKAMPKKNMPKKAH